MHEHLPHKLITPASKCTIMLYERWASDRAGPFACLESDMADRRQKRQTRCTQICIAAGKQQMPLVPHPANKGRGGGSLVTEKRSASERRTARDRICQPAERVDCVKHCPVPLPVAGRSPPVAKCHWARPVRSKLNDRCAFNAFVEHSHLLLRYGPWPLPPISSC